MTNISRPTSSSSGGWLAAGQLQQLGGDDVGRDACAARLGDQLAQPLAEARLRPGRGLGRRALLDRGPAAAPEVEPPLLGQRAIGLRHGVVVNAQIDRDLADRRQLIAGPEVARHQARPDGVGDLTIGRHRRVEIDPQGRVRGHWRLYRYNIHLRAAVKRPCAGGVGGVPPASAFEQPRPARGRAAS
jgi:hypothetical protein